MPGIAAALATNFLPGFLLGLVSCWHSGIIKTFIAHPSILLMPTFTHFAFASSTKWCKRSQEEEGKEEDEEEDEGKRQEKTEPYIAFSSKATVCNLLLSTLGFVIFCLRYTQIHRYDISFFIFILLLGLLFTVLSLVLNSARPTCCRCNCTCTCSCSSRPDSSCSFSCPLPSCCFTLPKPQFGALIPSTPYSHYVLDANGKPELVEDEESKMVNHEKGIENQDAEMVEAVVIQAGTT